jgi:hypothetical protein
MDFNIFDKSLRWANTTKRGFEEISDMISRNSLSTPRNRLCSFGKAPEEKSIKVYLIILFPVFYLCQKSVQDTQIFVEFD